MEELEAVTHAFCRQVATTRLQDLVPMFHAAKMGLVDYFAASFQGIGDDGTKRLLQYLNGNGDAPLIGLNRTVPPEQSTLFNGFLGHALDFDDVHPSVRGHPSTVIIPALLALSSVAEPTGGRFLAAYCIGVETMARFGKAVGQEHYKRGYHNTATLGVFGSAVAGSYLLRLDEEQLAHAVGFAAAQSSGMRMHFGTEAKPLQAGLAAQKGVQAVLLAKAGMQCNRNALDGQMGFFGLYGEGDELARGPLLQYWGKQWEIVAPGLWFKQYPFCSGGCHVADAAVSLYKQNRYAVDDIERVEILFPPHGDVALVKKAPSTGEEGRFSAEYIAAVGLLGLPYSFPNFNSDPIQEPIKQLMRKIKRVYASELDPLPQAQPKGRFAILRILFKDQRILEERVDVPKGAPGNALTEEEIYNKLIVCAGKDKAGKLISLINNLEQQKDISALLRCLRSA